MILLHSKRVQKNFLIQSKTLGISLELCYIGNKKSKEVRNTRKTQKEGSS